MDKFKIDLTKIINYHGLDNNYNIPDRILADFLIKSLAALETVNREVLWQQKSEDMLKILDAEPKNKLGVKLGNDLAKLKSAIGNKINFLFKTMVRQTLVN